MIENEKPPARAGGTVQTAVEDEQPGDRVWAILFSNGWRYTTDPLAASDAEERGLRIAEYVRA